MGKSISRNKLSKMLEADQPPVVVDVRKETAWRESGEMIPTAFRIPQDDIAMSSKRFIGRTVVVYCVHGHEVSRGAREILARNGIEAFYLEGGFEAWKEAGLPTAAQTGDEA